MMFDWIMTPKSFAGKWIKIWWGRGVYWGGGNSSRWGAGLSKFLTDVGGLSSFPLVEKTLGIPGGLKVKSKLPPCKCFVALTQFIETHSQKAAITFF